MLWNRLDPQYHMYYADRALKENKQLLPTIRLVQALDPQFVQSYYNGAWIVAELGDFSTALDLAHDGITNNPTSGLLRASYIQLLLYREQGPHHEPQPVHAGQIVAQADVGTRDGIVWVNDAEKFEGYAVFAAAYRIAGVKEKARAAQAVVDELRASSYGREHRRGRSRSRRRRKAGPLRTVCRYFSRISTIARSPTSTSTT